MGETREGFWWDRARCGANWSLPRYNRPRMFPAGSKGVVQEALRALGVRNLVLGIHDPAFPGLPEMVIPVVRLSSETWGSKAQSLGNRFQERTDGEY